MSYLPGLTDTQLRATALPVSGTVTVGNASLAVTGAFFQTTQPVSGTVTVANASLAVTGTFFQATQPVSAASLPLPTGAATETTLAALNTKVTAVNTGAVTISAALPAGTNAIGSVTRVDTTASGSITAISQNVALALNGKSGASIQITGTWVGTLQFEGTVDGTNWTAINGVFAGTSTPGSTITANGIVRLTPSGLAQFRITSTAWTSGTATISLRASDATGGTFLNQSLTAGTNVIGALVANQSVNNTQINGVAVSTGTGTSNTGTQRVTLATDVPLPPAATPPATYSASIVGLATAATATDIFTITGSATKTVRVARIMVNGVQTTSAQVNVLIVKRSTANTAGTSTAPTRVPYDSASAAATATVLAYTANPTLGTAVGTASASRAFIPGAATASDAQGLEIVSGGAGQQIMTLRGIAEVLAVNLNGVTVTGSAINVTVEWTET